MKKLLLLSILLLTLSSAFCQDPQFTQFYAAPLYLNPAFAGATGETRAILNARVQWVGLPHPFTTYAVSADHSLDKIRSGIGILATVDRAGTGGLTSTSVNAIYSYKLPLMTDWVFRPAIQFGYSSRSLDFYKLTFGDQLDLSGVSGIPTGEFFDNSDRVQYFDFSAGSVLYNKMMWIGISTHHLNRPDQSLNEGESQLPIKTSIHGGIKIDLTNKVYARRYGNQRDKSLTPAFNYKSQGRFDQFDIGLYYHYEPLVIGAWYRGIPGVKRYERGYGNNDSFAVLLGFKQDDFTIGYSYDLTVSRLTPTATAGSHELSLSYTFTGAGKDQKKKMKRKDMVIPCPKF